MVNLDANVEFWTVATRLGVACVLSMLIGYERERRNKPAGLRTHMLVGLGAAAFFLIFVEFALGSLKEAENISPDPTRIIEGVITGIGFLGAGAIIQNAGSVRGLTTGAGIWVAGTIGLACGGGYFVIAGVVTGFTIIILALAGFLQARYLDSEEAEEETGG
jgi:putative Mg2+ transporter-C (MgtC) family protein